MISIPLDHEIFVNCFMYLDMVHYLLVYIVYRNLNRICILLLYENYINLNDVEFIHMFFRSTIFIYLSVYSINS